MKAIALAFALVLASAPAHAAWYVVAKSKYSRDIETVSGPHYSFSSCVMSLSLDRYKVATYSLAFYGCVEG